MKYGTLVRILDDRDLAGECEAKFSLLENMGMDACQFIYKPEKYVLEDADVIRESAARHGIEISARFCGFRDPFVTWGVNYGFCNDGINVPGEERRPGEYRHRIRRFSASFPNAEGTWL